MFDDLVELKHGPNSDIVNKFMCSNIASFKNNYDDVCKFLGTFFFCSWLGFTPKQARNKKHSNAIFHPDKMHKLMDYEECANVWNEISAKVLNRHECQTMK